MGFFENFFWYTRDYSEDQVYDGAFLSFLNVLVTLLLVLSLCVMAGAVLLVATSQPLGHPIYCIIIQGGGEKEVQVSK